MVAVLEKGQQMSKEVKERTAALKASIQYGVKRKIIFYECEHVKRNELSARIGVYLGENKRLLLCKICAAVVLVQAEKVLYEDTFYRQEKEELNNEIKRLLNKIDELRAIPCWQFWRRK